MGGRPLTVLVDTHVLHWWTAEPGRLSKAARHAIESADEVAVSVITWWELAWLAEHGRIILDVPMRAWLDMLSAGVRSVTVTPAIAATAVALRDSFQGDPADRIIYATAIEQGWRLVTKDARLRRYRHPRPLTIW